MRVLQLRPGDRVAQGGEEATFVQRAEHPVWPHLYLVIWKMADGTWSHDALDGLQEIGSVVSQPEDRMQNLRQALLS